MLGCDNYITLWIKKKPSEKGASEHFERVALTVKCKWKNYTERVINNGAANIYNGVVIIIPYFEGLSKLNIKEGDIAALGIHDIKITGTSPYTASEIRQLLSPRITVIKSVSHNYNPDNKSMKGAHLRLTGN